MNGISEEQYEMIRPYLPVQRGNVRIGPDRQSDRVGREAVALEG
ncbi:MAG: hypothetical protein ACK5NN_01580 [Sphingomonadaceae bacterium]